jgi:hypothetical protein
LILIYMLSMLRIIKGLYAFVNVYADVI